MLHIRNEKWLMSYVLILFLIVTSGHTEKFGNPQNTTASNHAEGGSVKGKDTSSSTAASKLSMSPKSQLSMTTKSELSMTSESTSENTHPKKTSRVVDSTSSPYNEPSRGFNSKEKRAPAKNEATTMPNSLKLPNEELQVAIEKINNLKVSYNDSLKNAVTIIQDLFNDLNKRVNPQLVNKKDGKGTVNFLIATQTLESFAFEYAKTHLKNNESRSYVKENYEMMIQRLATNRTEPLVYPINNTAHEFGKDWVGIVLPPEVLKGKDIAIFVIYYDISQLVPECQALKLQKHIIAAKVHPPPEGNLQENVTISFGRDKKEVDKPRCMFWNFTIKSAFNGSWSRKGCSLVKSDDNETICTCNHLTNFAILMQVGKLEDEDTSKHLVAMEMITYVGCALSLTAEVLTIIAYSTLTDFKQEQVQIRLNLVVALASAQIAFLSGIDAFEPKSLCVLVAALIHYFYLVGFAWMFFEGVYLYLMVVKVFNTEIRLRAFYSVAWGCPAGIVVLSIILAACQEGGLHNYINGDFCWVSFSNNLIWTFVAPVLLVCVTNAVLLFFVIHEILKMRSNKAPNAEKLRQAAKACVFLSPLLGMTWAFGILSVTNAGLVFQYIFIVLNSLQGFFIFLLHILRNADVRAEFKRKKRMWFEKAKLLLFEAVCRRG
ncbi:PREDICTED: adhesion G-protein coupled receptor D1-like isoform X3 [Acropora digitifera]|uniref:adhesion G-protein coupled receptor D1-like isoform X3 n=1 Tax=Acropora digitifera TaxID=70779 RepID=UPI00077AB3FF|nr:PREDICTED: adhesion G-protein coupled receptor D1-like isoform X3 [Acropora digitifera]